MADAIDVDAAGGDVGGDQGPHLTGLELGQRPLALALALVAVDGGGLDADGSKLLGHSVGAALGAGEDQHPLHGAVIHQFRQQGALAALFDEEDLLVDLLDGGGLGRHRHLGRVLQKFAGQLADLCRHGGGKEQVLALLGQGLGDLADRHDKAHIEHLVGFIQNEDFGLRQVGDLLVDMVDQPARGGDKHINAGGQGADLGSVFHAAENNRDR